MAFTSPCLSPLFGWGSEPHQVLLHTAARHSLSPWRAPPPSSFAYRTEDLVNKRHIHPCADFIYPNTNRRGIALHDSGGSVSQRLWSWYRQVLQTQHTLKSITIRKNRTEFFFRYFPREFLLYHPIPSRKGVTFPHSAHIPEK